MNLVAGMVSRATPAPAPMTPVGLGLVPNRRGGGGVAGDGKTPGVGGDSRIVRGEGMRQSVAGRPRPQPLPQTKDNVGLGLVPNRPGWGRVRRRWEKTPA